MGNQMMLASMAMDFMRSGMSPMQYLTQKIVGNNPALQQDLQRALDMVQNKTPQETEQIVRNVAQQQGVNLDSAISQAQQFMGGQQRY